MKKPTKREREIAVAARHDTVSRYFAHAQVDERDFLVLPDSEMSLAEREQLAEDREGLAISLMRLGRETGMDNAWRGQEQRSDTRKRAAEFIRLVDAKHAAGMVLHKAKAEAAKELAAKEVDGKPPKPRTIYRWWSDAGRAKSKRKPVK